jgi:hypothetical protein
MRASREQEGTMATVSPLPRLTVEQIRIWAQYREMPGLRLTVPQVCRLCALEPAEGIEALRALDVAGVLRRVGPYWIRADLDAFVA